MDPRDNNDSFGKNVDRVGESKGNKSCKDNTKQRDRGDVFTAVSNQPGTSASNGPLAGIVNSVLNDNRPPAALSGTNPEYGRDPAAPGPSHTGSNTDTHPLNQQEPTVSRIPKTCNHTPEIEQSCQRHKVCLDKVANNFNVPSTSGASKPCDKIDNSAFKESRKRPSSLRLNRQNDDEEESSSDTGNDDCSLGSEDGCVYTYRGGEHLADLPSSFFSLDMGLPLDMHLPAQPNYVPRPEAVGPVVRERSRESSPDMDFLEMDFDPGPSNEVDSGEELSPDELNADLEAGEEIIEEIAEVLVNRQSPGFNLAGSRPKSSSCEPLNVSSFMSCPQPEPMPSTSSGITRAVVELKPEPQPSGSRSGLAATSSEPCGSVITHINVRGEHLLVRRTTSQTVPNVPVSLHVSSGDLVSPRELLNQEEQPEEGHLSYQINQGERPTFDPLNLSSTLYHLNMAKRLMVEGTAAEIENNDIANFARDTGAAGAGDGAEGAEGVAAPRCMVWTEREACERQVTQIATSACGATAVVNVFIALGAPVNVDRINAAVGTRQRANHAPLARYLLTRAVAGCTAADLVSGIQRASDGLVTARFFPTYPERVVSLSHWLADWISLGAVPILTLNLQVGAEGETPDAWHHQMVFGVSSRGIYLCNPVECVRETALWPRLASPSNLLIRTRDVLQRFTPRTDLTPLMAVPDRRWHTANVLGQVVNVIREWRATGWSEHGVRTRHISIPASYQAGVTIAALTGSEAHRRLMHASQLPLLYEDGHSPSK